ncbi:type II toxin-antitoxin system ParD family antitoxin [Dankookia sp. P2]|uniref:type II toxin-antitoxin system ParD family antitoxin n=1 Tax=Dankookia sp. P2 TaxID=3423955 RepID=UPI003D67773F
MPSRSACSVSLTPTLAGYVAAQVASGRYRTASEVMRAALRLMQQSEPDTQTTAEAGLAQTQRPVAQRRRQP